ncbi:Hypothetical protein CINCED_3A010091 [Cinara cedri]|uniref:Uncharacterized protein n=1 Tax=Cinara cedri TaxID=506608 RepID=A0A5E4M9U9_9HEMI|nr:Hypothetical protein CINCED_3A010091 [Cinara cedri]
MVTVNGESFTQVFIMEHRPERPLTYIIVSSLTRHFSAGPLTDRQALDARFAAGDCAVKTGLPMAGLKTKEQVYYAPKLATYYETLSDTDPNNTQSDIAAKILQHILSRIPPRDIRTSQKTFLTNNATNNLPHSILNHILLHIPPPEIEPSSPNIAIGNVQPTLAENILQLEFVKPVTNPTEVSTFHEPLSDYKPENTQSHMAVKILQHIMLHVPPPDIQTSKEPFYMNNATGSLQPTLAENNLQLEIVKPLANPTEVSTFYESIPDTAPENTQSHMAVKILKHIMLHVPPPDIRTSKDFFYTNNAIGSLQPTVAEKNLQLEILKPVPIPNENSNFREPVPDNVTDVMEPDIDEENSSPRILNSVFRYAVIDGCWWDMSRKPHNFPGINSKYL